jgi:hypothetical protein
MSPVFPTDIDIAKNKRGQGCLKRVIEVSSIHNRDKSIMSQGSKSVKISVTVSEDLASLVKCSSYSN